MVITEHAVHYGLRNMGEDVHNQFGRGRDVIRQEHLRVAEDVEEPDEAGGRLDPLHLLRPH